MLGAATQPQEHCPIKSIARLSTRAHASPHCFTALPHPAGPTSPPPLTPLGVACRPNARSHRVPRRRFNQATRRWEKPTPHIYKDPFLSSLITLKPPKMVHDPATKKQMEAGTRRKQSVTLDGVNIRDAYRQREQGTRT